MAMGDTRGKGGGASPFPVCNSGGRAKSICFFTAVKTWIISQRGRHCRLRGIFILTEIFSSCKDAQTSGEAADKAVFYAIDLVSEAILSKRIADEGEVNVNTSAFNMKLQRTSIDANMSINITDDSDEVLVKLPKVPESSLKDGKFVDIQVSLRSKTQCKIICGYTGIVKT